MGLGVREAGPALVCRVVELVCALPLEAVIETMRPLPIDALGAMPPFVLGVSVIRGAPVVVVDAGLLVGTRATSAGRLVTVRVGERTVALAVDSVIGVRTLDAGALAGLSPLLDGAAGEAVTAIGVVDAELLVMLRAARLVPESVLAQLENGSRT